MTQNQHLLKVRILRPKTWLALLLPIVGIALLAACGSSSGASSAPATLQIVRPGNNATVGRSFVVAFDSNRKIGEPSTGLNHVHLYYDGNRTTNQADYDKAYTKSFTVTRLGPGRHTIDAVLANADHSVTNVSTRITVDVSASAPNDGGTTPPTTSSGAYG